MDEATRSHYFYHYLVAWNVNAAGAVSLNVFVIWVDKVVLGDIYRGAVDEILLLFFETYSFSLVGEFEFVMREGEVWKP